MFQFADVPVMLDFWGHDFVSIPFPLPVSSKEYVDQDLEEEMVLVPL
jgi:hypothetical protein